MSFAIRPPEENFDQTHCGGFQALHYWLSSMEKQALADITAPYRGHASCAAPIVLRTVLG
jgi:hypothetical protein